jgi:hypothetical protein
MKRKGSRDLGSKVDERPSSQWIANSMVCWYLGIEDRPRYCSLDALAPRFVGILISLHISSKSTWSLNHLEPWHLKIKVPGYQGTE